MLQALAEQLENPSKEENWQRLDLLATGSFNPPPVRKSSIKQHDAEEEKVGMTDMTVEDVIEAVNVTDDDAIVAMIQNLEDEDSFEEDPKNINILKQNSQSQSNNNKNEGSSTKSETLVGKMLDNFSSSNNIS